MTDTVTQEETVARSIFDEDWVDPKLLADMIVNHPEELYDFRFGDHDTDRIMDNITTLFKSSSYMVQMSPEGKPVGEPYFDAQVYAETLEQFLATVMEDFNLVLQYVCVDKLPYNTGIPETIYTKMIKSSALWKIFLKHFFAIDVMKFQNFYTNVTEIDRFGDMHPYLPSPIQTVTELYVEKCCEKTYGLLPQ